MLTTRHWSVTSLFHTPDSPAFARRAGDRLLQLASGLGPSAHALLQLTATGSGRLEVTLTVTSGHPELDPDVQWVWEDVAEVEALETPRPSRSPRRLAEVVVGPRPDASPWGELAPSDDASPRLGSLPTFHLRPGLDLLKALRLSRAEIRLALGPVNEVAASMLTHDVRRRLGARDDQLVDAYVGSPVAARLFVAHDGPLSPRLRAVLLGQGDGLRLEARDPGAPDTLTAWRGDAPALASSALAYEAARCLTVVPAADQRGEVCGMPIVAPRPQPVAIDDAACREGLRLGSGYSSDGQVREVRLGLADLVLHGHVLGSSGSGKSTLAAAIVRAALDHNLGVSVLSPHSELVDRLLAEMPASQAHRVIAVRSGDVWHPVPVNPLAGPDPDQAAGQLVELMRELHDPGGQGFLGPVWEQWFGVLLEFQRAVLGSAVSLPLMADLVADRGRLAWLGGLLGPEHEELARELRQLAGRRSEEFNEIAGWFASKFQRLRTPLMRGILGSGEDSVDVVEAMDNASALFVDLAAPEIGDHSAQFLGELWLAKHWDALARRRDPGRPHLLVVDEAHLFGSGLLPRFLTQARKFGVGVVLAHQNLEQLTPALREAALSSTNNVFVFRTGIREAISSYERLGTWRGAGLSRLDRLTAACTLNSGGVLTEAFTLVVDHNDRLSPADPRVAQEIADRTRRRYATASALGDAMLEFESALRAKRGEPREPSNSDTETESLLRRVLRAEPISEDTLVPGEVDSR